MGLKTLRTYYSTTILNIIFLLVGCCVEHLNPRAFFLGWEGAAMARQIIELRGNWLAAARDLGY